MRRLLAALIGSIGLTATTTIGAAADTSLTSVVLSCSDGHSVALTVDQATLTSLLADVQALNLSGTNSCTVDTATADPSSQTTDWTVFDYNSSNRALSPRNSPNKSPAFPTDGGTTWNFFFQPNVYTALFTTTDPSVTGNLCPSFPLTCKTLNDDISLSGNPPSTFMTRGQGMCGSNVPAVVRFYFTAPSASGPSVEPPPGGFFTKFWWSDSPVEYQMFSGMATGHIAVSLSDESHWSDWDGKSALNESEAFIEATQHVQSIGFSFGGECQFETGVISTSTAADELFSSTFTES